MHIDMFDDNAISKANRNPVLRRRGMEVDDQEQIKRARAEMDEEEDDIERPTKLTPNRRADEHKMMT